MVLSLACNGPTGFFSGGRLDGEVTPIPEGWALTESRGVGQLETQPDDPYSVNIAYTIIEGSLFINAGDTETNWVQNIAANPSVRLRVGDAIYLAEAQRVTDRPTIEEFGRAWTAQSSFYRDPAELDEVWIYRLVAPAP